jgi:hypothetical protein
MLYVGGLQLEDETKNTCESTWKFRGLSLFLQSVVCSKNFSLLVKNFLMVRFQLYLALVGHHPASIGNIESYIREIVND